MTSNKTLATLFLIVLNMQRAAASSSSSTQKPSPSGESAPLVRKRRPILKSNEMLADASNTGNDVEVHRESAEETSTSQELSASQVDNQFRTLIEKDEYTKIFELGKNMSDEEFLRQLCPVIETLDQYKRVVDYLRNRDLVVSFYIHGNIEVVRNIIFTKSWAYNDHGYIPYGNLEEALPLALKENYHDRVVGLLKIRKELTAEKDEQAEKEGETTSFQHLFVDQFLYKLAPWEDGMALKRFLTFHGDELGSKHPDILDALCQGLVDQLKVRMPNYPDAAKMLADLIGQNLLLTPKSFVKGFLFAANDRVRSNFIKYAWRDAIKEGLRKEHQDGGEELWRVMKKENPALFFGDYPDSEKTLNAVLRCFLTKRQKEIKWIISNAPGFLNELDQAFAGIFPKVLVFTVIGYTGPTWIDVQNSRS